MNRPYKSYTCGMSSSKQTRPQTTGDQRSPLQAACLWYTTPKQTCLQNKRNGQARSLRIARLFVGNRLACSACSSTGDQWTPIRFPLHGLINRLSVVCHHPNKPVPKLRATKGRPYKPPACGIPPPKQTRLQNNRNGQARSLRIARLFVGNRLACSDCSSTGDQCSPLQPTYAPP